MDTSSLNEEVVNPSPRGVKRKHSPEDRDPLGNENPDQSKPPLKKSVHKTVAANRKRKFLFKNDSTPTKCGGFYFLNPLMTKSRRRSKITPPAAVEETSPDDPPDNHHKKLHFARFDSFGNAFLMHRSYLKSDLFFNDEKKCNYEDFKKVDLSFHVLDEIALEGLDGITLEAFWKRFRNVFPNNVNKSVADRIWRMICNNKRINFYILREPREELTFFDCCRYLDIDSGMFVEPFIDFKDIYPLASVNGTDIRGSCSTYTTRKENNGVRKFSMEKAIKLYDQKLVFVADQAVRNRAIIHDETDPNIDLMDVEYCLLEKIGRSRAQGEFTQGKMSVINDNKKLYHNRKALMHYSLIVHQTFCLKSLPSQQNMAGGLVHLTRFYHKRKPKHIMIMERIANLLRTKPNYQVELPEFRKIFGKHIAIIKLLKTQEFRKFFKIYTYPYRKLYPNASKHEYLHKNKQRERQIRVLRMLDPCANVTAIAESKENKEVQQEQSSESPGRKLMNYEYLRDIFLYILSAGPVGVTLHEIHDHFKMDFYSMRMATRKLMIRNVVGSSKIDLGRQQSLKFFAKCYESGDCAVKLEPKEHQLSDETLASVFRSYQQKSLEFNPESEPTTAPDTSKIVEFKLEFAPFCCSAFLTETVDATSEEQTIYDIVNKGRDRILLLQSNLFAHYLSEWDDFLLKRDDFSKSIRLFLTGFGKIICDFLSTVKMDLEPDNNIIFQLKDVTVHTKIEKLVLGQRILKVAKNYTSPHSDLSYRDPVAMIYLFEAMLNESHRTNKCASKLKSVFERFMAAEGKRKREPSVCDKPEAQIEITVPSEVAVMEKFMGDQPQLLSTTHHENIKIEMFESTKVKTFVKNGSVYNPGDVNLTQRYIRRANLILKTIHEQQVVKEARTLFNAVRAEEDAEGYDKKVCKKSIISILAKLVQEGYIKVYKVVMTGTSTVRTQSFFCSTRVSTDHNIILSAVEQLKLKFYVGSVPAPKTIKVKKNGGESPFSSSDVKNSIVELKQLTSVKMPDCKVDKAIGRAYGYVPKFLRLRALHEHLFYVIRELTERDPLTNRQVFDVCKTARVKMSQDEILELAPVFRPEIGWKMFIPALPQQTSWPKGWALACDIILRMPLSIFVKLYNVVYEISGLDAYLKHPVKRHYLIKNLPVNIRNVLLHRRKYFHSIYETLCYLCYMGLLQLGPRNFKEKDQMFMYLNARASLYDTCSSKPGYNKIEDKTYKKTVFEFKTCNDVELYWSEMLRICMNTRLGKRKILDGQCVTIEDCNSKPVMVETLKAKTFEQALKDDVGRVPGDRSGAAGVDSSLWSYVKKNWLWSQNEPKHHASTSQVKKDKVDLVLPQPIQKDLLAKNGGPERKVYLKPATKKTNIKSIMVKMASRKKIVRKIVANRSVRVREYYDALDKAIMKKNVSSRVDWDEDEDQLLRHSRAASVFLCPEYKKQFIPYTIIRDVLHRLCPKTKNKTARAIQRRIYVLLTNDETIRIMESNIDNFLNSDTISKYFEQIHNRYKNNSKMSDSHVYIAFIYLMSYVYKHRKEVELLLLGHFATFDFFSDANITEFENVLQEESTNTDIYVNPKTLEDITKDTIRSVVHSSMACKKNTIGWTFHLSSIYKKFKDELLRSTVQEMKKLQFFALNRNYESKTVNNAWPTPLKFSHLYNTMKSVTYSREMCQDAFQSFVAAVAGETLASFMAFNEVYTFWENVDLAFEIPEMGIILNPEMDDHDEVIDELSKRFRLYLEKIYEKKGATKVSDKEAEVGKPEEENEEEPEKNMDLIKREVRHLIFRVPYLLEGNLEWCFKNMLESTTSSQVYNYIRLMIVDLKSFVQTCKPTAELNAFLEDIEAENGVENAQNVLKNLSKVVFAIQNIQQEENQQCAHFKRDFDAWEAEIWDEVRPGPEEMRRETRLTKNQAGGMANCIKRAQGGDFPTIEEIKKGMMTDDDGGQNREIPHITDLIMLLTEGRFPELDNDDNETVEKMKEHFVVQYPKLQHFLIGDLEEMKASLGAKQILDDSKTTRIGEICRKYIASEPQLDQIVSHIRELNGNEGDIKATESLIDFIKERKEFGVAAQEVKTRFSDELSVDLVQLLCFLCDAGILLRTGVVSFVYVHHDFQNEWLTETFALSTQEQKVFESKGKQELKNLRVLIGKKLESKASRRVQLKPWTKLDGSVNDELLKEWLSRVLSRCLDTPNITLLALCDVFHYIKPVDLYLLLELLQELGCVKLCVYDLMETSLFSDRALITERDATCLDCFAAIFVKATSMAGLCFGALGTL